MKALGACVLGVALSGIAACGSCGKSSNSIDAAPSPSVDVAVAPSPVVASAFPLSLPFAAAIGAEDDVYVAGLIAARHAIALGRYSSAGQLRWVSEIVDDVDWAPDAEVRVVAHREAIGVVWHGPRNGASVRELVIVGADGKRIGETEPVAGAVCATDASILWTSVDGGKPLLLRRDGAGAARSIDPMTPQSADATLACGRERVYIVDESDESAGVASTSARGGIPRELISGAEPEDDEVRDREVFTVGDDLGVVRVTSDGAVSLREANPRVTKWRTASTRLRADDGVAAVDGDAQRAMVVYIRDDDARCGGAASAHEVRALGLRREGAPRDVRDEERLVAAIRCGVDAAPFFVGPIGNRGPFVVAWGERASAARGEPPIAGFGWRAFDASAPSRVDVRADGLTFAGCSAMRCYAVALVRTDADALAPGQARVLPFP